MRRGREHRSLMKHWTKYMPTESGTHLTSERGPENEFIRAPHVGLRDIAANDSEIGREARRELARRCV